LLSARLSTQFLTSR